MGLFVVVALITYACTRSSSPDEGGQASDTTPSPTPEQSSPPSVSPSPSVSASPSASPGAGEDAEDGAEDGAGGGSGDSGDESGGGSEHGSGEGSGEYAAPENPGDLCRPSDVVVTLKANKSDYDWNDRPKFKLTLVNTENQTCTVDVGPKNMELLIKSGDDRIFSTADCVEGSGKDKQRLERGVPFTETITWKRLRSSDEECKGKQVKAKRPGTYVAALKSDYDTKVEPQVFRLN